MKVICAAFMCLQMFFLMFWQKKFGAKAARKMLMTLATERKLGPKLMGVFPGGRLEEYIPVRC